MSYSFTDGGTSRSDRGDGSLRERALLGTLPVAGGLGERQTAEPVQDHEVVVGELVGDAAMPEAATVLRHRAAPTSP